MFPKAGGNYVICAKDLAAVRLPLRWTLFVVIQPARSRRRRRVRAFHVGAHSQPYPDVSSARPCTSAAIGDIAVGLSPQRIFAIASIALLTWINVRGVRTAAFIKPR